MEPNAMMDWILAGLALAIVLGGLGMLLGGVLKMGRK
jgi:hypothetical protein